MEYRTFRINPSFIHFVLIIPADDQTGHGMAFSMSDIVSITIIIRDLAVNFVKTILPDSRSRLMDIDPR